MSAAGMVPLIWFSLRRGVRSGVWIGAVYGLVHMALGGYVVNPVEALLDYPLAYAVLGLAGKFRGKPLMGVGVGIFGRFLVHSLSGLVFFAMYAPAVIAGMNPFVYTALYNGSYLVPELAISLVLMYIIVKRRLLEIYL